MDGYPQFTNILSKKQSIFLGAQRPRREKSDGGKLGATRAGSRRPTGITQRCRTEQTRAVAHSASTRGVRSLGRPMAPAMWGSAVGVARTGRGGDIAHDPPPGRRKNFFSAGAQGGHAQPLKTQKTKVFRTLLQKIPPPGVINHQHNNRPDLTRQRLSGMQATSGTRSVIIDAERARGSKKTIKKWHRGNFFVDNPYWL